MPCSVAITSINGIVQPGQTDPTTIRVTGTATQCASVSVTTSVTAPAAPAAVDANGRWYADLAVTAATLHCGDSVQVRAECMGQSTCFDQASVALKCCEIPTLFFQAVALPGSLTPSQLVVQGVIRGCPGDQVVIGSSITALSGPIPADPKTGVFTATLPITQAAQCDDEISVTASCASSTGCSRRFSGPLNCPACYRASISVTQGACRGTPPRQPVTLAASIAIGAGQSITFYWDYGDSSTGPRFTINNAGGTAATPHAHSETHDYAPGSYNATLRVVGPPYECAEVSVRVVAQCGGTCPVVVPAPPQVSMTCVNGKRTVILGAQVTPPAGQTVVAQWDFGDGSMGAAVVVNPGATGSVPDQHDYFPGTYNAKLKTVLPAGCPDVTVPVVVPVCVPPPCTLQVQSLNIQVGPCNVDGTRTVTATAVLANTDPADRYYWTWDSTPAQVGLPALLGTTQSHDYPAPGSGLTTCTITLTVVRSSTCVHSFSTQVTISGCGGGAPCPQLTDILITAGNCSAGATTRPVNLTAQGTGGNAASYDWDFGDGSASVTTNSPAAPVHSYAAPSTATARVTAHTPGCPDSSVSRTVSVAGCPPPPDGGGGDGLSACDILLWIALGCIALGGLLAIVGCVLYHYYPYAGLVVGIIGGVLLAIGLILFVIWWIVCRFLTLCSVLLAAIDFVTAMIFIFGIISAILAIVAVFVHVPSMWACVGQAVLTWAGWGVILAVLVWLARSRRCLIANPSGGSSSSSSGLTSSGADRLNPQARALAARTPAGMGDVMKSAFAAMGLPTCVKCGERAQRLNQWFPFEDRVPVQARTAPRSAGPA